MFSSIEERSRSICDVKLKQNCRESCSLLHPRDFRNADDWFSFWKGIGFCLLILSASVLNYILIGLWAINIVDYILLSTKCFNRGRSIWNSNASPKFNFLHANTKYTRSTPQLKWTWNLHVMYMILNFKCTDFFTLCQKEKCVSLLIIHCDVVWNNVE